MKKNLLILGIAIVSVSAALGQGRVNFNNTAYLTPLPITAGATSLVGDAAPGQNVGATFSAQLVWAAQGSYGSLAAFITASLGSSTPVAFFGATGGSTTTDGAGLFDAGAVSINPVGTYTMVALAWYNNGTYGTYNAAAGAGHDVGNSAFFDTAVTAAPTAANNTVFNAFTVQPVPEPGTLALLGLGAGALALIRRRK